MKDPTLTLLDSAGNVLAFNDNWVDSPDRQAIKDTGVAPADRREPAILRTLPAGIYTAVARGVNDTTGTVVSEVYDLNLSHDTVEIPSIGTRASVGVADKVMISGIIVVGSSRITVLVIVGGRRYSGSSRRSCADACRRRMTTGRWRTRHYILASGFAPDNRLESALITTLSAGSYTAIVAGTNGGVGVAFLQYYSLANPGPELDPAPIIE